LVSNINVDECKGSLDNPFIFEEATLKINRNHSMDIDRIL